MSATKAADLSSALAAFEAELSGLTKRPPPVKKVNSTLSSAPALSVASFSAPPVIVHRPDLDVNAHQQSEPSMQHTYSTVYGHDMQNKYNEAQTKAMQFRTEAQQQAAGYGRAPRVGSITRKAAGKVWEDQTLVDWPENDYRLFCGDLGNEVNDELLASVFTKYPSFAKAKVLRQKKTQKTKGYGFVSFLDVNDFMAAFKEVNGKYVGNRPIKLRKSTWKERNATS